MCPLSIHLLPSSSSSIYGHHHLFSFLWLTLPLSSIYNEHQVISSSCRVTVSPSHFGSVMPRCLDLNRSIFCCIDLSSFVDCSRRDHLISFLHFDWHQADYAHAIVSLFFAPWSIVDRSIFVCICSPFARRKPSLMFSSRTASPMQIRSRRHGLPSTFAKRPCLYLVEGSYGKDEIGGF